MQKRQGEGAGGINFTHLVARAEAPEFRVTITGRETARQMVIDSVPAAAHKSHERNYEKLHIHRDGTVSWFESICQSDDLIDRDADGFDAIPSVITVGTGGFACNCDYCNDIGKVIDGEVLTAEDAIGNAIGDADLSDMEAEMLRKLDEIPAGYFADEYKEVR